MPGGGFSFFPFHVKSFEAASADLSQALSMEDAFNERAEQPEVMRAV